MAADHRALLPCLALLLGCPDEAPEPLPPDAGPAAPWVAGPVAEASEPERLELNWRVAVTAQRNARMDRAYFRGPERLPELGFDGSMNLSWAAARSEEDGSFGQRNNGWLYAVTEVDPSQGMRLFALADRVYAVFAGGISQPGDVYGRGNRFIPLAGALDEGLIGLRTYANRGRPKVQVFATPDEIHLNLADRTFPHLLIGDATERWLGVPLLNLRNTALRDVHLKVVENTFFAASETRFEGVVAGAVTQVPFLLTPKAAWTDAEEEVVVRLRVESPSLEFSYEVETTLPKISPDEPYRQTFRSPIDGSVQYYGVRRPQPFDAEAEYGMVLSLHGASVEAIGQARAYSAKDWTYVIAATNRRPFGFDWEEWGRLNALAALDDAVARFRPDPTKMHLTGHSMGGHGTWHNGVMSPGRFATLGPSAGWSSFYSYSRSSRPTGSFARSRAHSDTNNYVSNLARRGVYIIHGDADDNVPIREGREMFALVSGVTDDIEMHEEPGAGHWWNGDAAEGADCVDWPPLFAFMQARRLDPFELDFSFRSPRPGYASHHSYVFLESARTSDEDLVITSSRDENTVSLVTTNTRSMRLNTKALRDAGVTSLSVDGEPASLDADELWLGPRSGKIATQYGPFNQVFHRPFCLLYDDSVRGYASHAAFLSSHWALQGNGSTCGLPLQHRAEAPGRNAVMIGGTMDDIVLPEGFPVIWNDDGITLNGTATAKAGLQFIAPDGDGLAAVLVTTPGHEDLLEGTVPFSSRAGMPDYIAWTTGRGLLTGFFGPEWTYIP